MTLFTFPLAVCAHCHTTGCNKRVGSHHYCSAACASAGPADVPTQPQQQDIEMARKPNAPSEPTGEAAPVIVARMTVDALEGDKIEGLREWIRDNVGTADEVAQAVTRWETDPEGGRRELQNVIAFHLEAGGPTPRIRAPKAVTLAARRLKGDLVAYILDLLRVEQDGDRRPWDQRPEAHQRAVIARINDRVEEALRHGFMVMLGERPRVIGGTLDSVTAKEDGVKAVVKIAPSAENLIDLLRVAGERVQIAVADPNAFMGMGDGIPVALDQTEMPLEPEPLESEPEEAAEQHVVH
jgi:hypothetical protein